jgi:threonylcarbamoyladenosine tRNA methylthiotransferase MtaB
VSRPSGASSASASPTDCVGSLISLAGPRNCQLQTVDGKLFPVATFYIQQFGCRATQADGAAIERQLLDRGSTVAVSPEAADVVVLNTCTVTSAADAQARDTIRKLHAANPATRIVVTGCYAQRAPEELAALPGVFHVVGNSHKPQIPDLLVPAPYAGTPRNLVPTDNLLAPILAGDIFELHNLLVAPVLGGEGHHTRPTLKIQDGCNNRCAFCVIPFVRGRSRSLPPQAVVEEVRKLSDSGYKEIVLSGINLGAWGRDLSPRRDFLDLLKKILDETGVERLRLSSIEPLDASRDLILLFASTPRLAEHFHMPLQSGSDRILAAMHRWYRTEHYARRVELIREHLPNAAIGADVITGFPGEIEEDHAATLDFIEQRPFTYLHVFSYSSRPGTRAASFPNHVPPNVVKERARELRALGEAKSASFYRSQSGRILSVLTLRHTAADIPDSTEWTPALSSNYLKVRISGAWPPNQFVNAVGPSSPQAIVSPALEESFAAI